MVPVGLGSAESLYMFTRLYIKGTLPLEATFQRGIFGRADHLFFVSACSDVFTIFHTYILFI